MPWRARLAHGEEATALDSKHSDSQHRDIPRYSLEASSSFHALPLPSLHFPVEDAMKKDPRNVSDLCCRPSHTPVPDPSELLLLDSIQSLSQEMSIELGADAPDQK
jgi:hypothetical protein